MKPTTPIHQTWHWDFTRSSYYTHKVPRICSRCRAADRTVYVHSIIPDPTDPVALGLFSDRLPVGEGIYVELYY